MQIRSAHRRTAEEWMQLISALKRSGLDEATFAAHHGLPPARVAWWRARLERAAVRRRQQARVGLVRVDVGAPTGTAVVAESTARGCSWEVVTEHGRLVVHGELAADVARGVLEVLVAGRPR